mmetsp:Transcript_5838/g.36206  ORF Transcript_5838/g.36206 Transcript_5838/m.36206 type:complete len:85 (+) Transcript_5838:1126-1380(+)
MQRSTMFPQNVCVTLPAAPPFHAHGVFLLTLPLAFLGSIPQIILGGMDADTDGPRWPPCCFRLYAFGHQAEADIHAKVECDYVE